MNSSTDGVTLSKKEFISLVAKNAGIPLAERIEFIRKNKDFSEKEKKDLIDEIK